MPTITVTPVQDRFTRSSSFQVTIVRFDGPVTRGGFANRTTAMAAGRQMLKEAAAAEQASLDEWARLAHRDGGAGYSVGQ